MKDLIQKLRAESLKVTMFDIGKGSAVFALAVAFDEPVDIWYIALAMGPEVIPRIEGRIMFFPELIVDAETYALICA